MSAQACVAFSVPGPAGAAGAAGTNGANGVNAFTTTTASFNMPASGGDVTVSVVNSTWMTANQKVYVAGAGYMEVRSKPGDTSVVLRNIETATLYTENADAGTPVTSGAAISPAGIQGPAGSTPAGALLAANNLSDVASPATSRTNLGLVIGTNVQAQDALLQALASLITAADRLAYFTGVDTVALTTLTAHARNLLDDIDAATMRTTLGLGGMATQSDSGVNILGGNIAGLTNLATADFTASDETKLNGPLFTAPSTIQTLLATGTITPNRAKVRVAGNAGPVVLVSTPTIATPADDGQFLLIMGTSDANSVTLNDETTTPNTKLQLGAGSRLLGAGDHILLSWDTTTGFWYEVAFSNN